MSHKDYIALATALRSTRPYVARRSTREQRATYKCWHNTRGCIMAVLAADNPNFDRQRFIYATEHSS